MNSTDKNSSQKIPILVDTIEENRKTEETEVATVTKNISRIRLTLEEIISNDNDASRLQYLSISSPSNITLSDTSSVSSTFDSETGSFVSSSSCSVRSVIDFGSKAFNDPFKGVEDDDFANLDRYGFMNKNNNISISEREFMEKERSRLEREREKEASRALKWISMLKSLEIESDVNSWPQKHKKFSERLVKGVPDCLRTRVWSKFLDTKGLYHNRGLKLDSSSGSETFASLYLKVSGFERQIDLDIERTLRDHVLFKIRYSQAQISLFKILVAYSNLDPEVGYCQGMSTIAAFLLLYFDETAAFEAFVKLMSRDDLRLMYRVGFPLLFEYFWIQERLMKKFLPRLWDHLGKHSITTSIYATKWYLTLFLSFPTRLAARIWDLFLFYGLDILPLTAIALLKIHEKKICGMGFEETMQFLGKIADAPSCSNPDELMRMIGRLGEKYFGSGSDPFNGIKCRGFKKYRSEYSKENQIQSIQK